MLFFIASVRAANTPGIPEKVFSILDYGAVGDGRTNNTDAITKTIAAAHAAGGGEVLVPAGRFLTGPLSFFSNINLHVDEKGALLLMNDIDKFPKAERGYMNGISFDNCHDIAITGRGTIDGQGQPWWEKYRKLPEGQEQPAARLPHRPFLVSINRCQRVRVEDISLANSPMFHLVPRDCEDVTITNINIHAPANSPNTDGIDPSGHNFTITGCHFDVGDDCIALKASSHVMQPACENFTITHCTFVHGHGMSVGSQTSGGLRHLIVRDCTFDSTDAGIRLKTGRGFGGLSEDLTYENLTMKNVKVAILITSYYPKIPKHPEDDPAQPVGATTPHWRHIRISNVSAVESKIAGQIIGVAEMPVEDVILTHVDLSAESGMQIVHAKGIRFVDCKVIAEKGAAIEQHDAQIEGME
jgi:polygalacturonase